MAQFPLNAAGTNVLYDDLSPIAYYAGALPYCANGALAVTSAAAITNWAPGGIPISATGRVCVGTGNADYHHNGLPFSNADGKLVFSPSGGTVAYYNNGLPFTSVGRIAAVQVFSPYTLFQASEQGGWYDPSDLSSMFQDSAGTVPVTAVEQPVGKINDKSGRGNHLTQATAASRPTLSALLNLLTNSEVFSFWGTKSNLTVTDDAMLSPLGSMTADQLTENTANTGHYLERGVTSPANVPNTYSVYLKSNGRQDLWLQMYANAYADSLRLSINTTTGVVTSAAGGTGVVSSATAENIGNGWWRAKLSGTPSTAAVSDIKLRVVLISGSTTYQGDGVSGCYVWGAQFEPGLVASRYQRVGASAAVYDSAGFPTYLRFDGVDDGLATAAITFTTDKVTMHAGVYKASDAASGTVAELSASSGTNTNCFALQAPPSDLTGYFWRSRGAGGLDGTIDLSGFPAPILNNITCQGDVAGDYSAIRVNGALTTTAVDQGTGNWGTFPLYVGRRGGTTLPLNGRLYGLIVRAALSSAQQITDAEAWMASKMA